MKYLHPLSLNEFLMLIVVPLLLLYRFLTKLKFTLLSAAAYEHSELNGFKNINFDGKISN